MESEYQAEARREAARQAYELGKVTQAQAMPALTFLIGAYQHDVPRVDAETTH